MRRSFDVTGRDENGIRLERDSAGYLCAILLFLPLILAGVAALTGNWSYSLLENTRYGDPTWYQDLAGRQVTEIQDQDLFRHNIGTSIAHARRADVIILGSSLAAFGFDSDILAERIERKYGLKVFNMAFVGIASGEFSRIIIAKYKLKPKLWIINADDGGGGGGGNFFSRSLVRSFGDDVHVIHAMQHGRMQAYRDVVRRNLRWRAEALIDGLARRIGISVYTAKVIPEFYRSVVNGASDMREFPKFLAEDNPPVTTTRNAECHTTSEIAASAKDFVANIGGKSVFTVIPNVHGCELQAAENASAAGAAFISFKSGQYSSWDNGHLDRRGARALTKDLVDQLERSGLLADITHTR